MTHVSWRSGRCGRRQAARRRHAAPRPCPNQSGPRWTISWSTGGPRSCSRVSLDEQDKMAHVERLRTKCSSLSPEPRKFALTAASALARDTRAVDGDVGARLLGESAAAVVRCAPTAVELDCAVRLLADTAGRPSRRSRKLYWDHLRGPRQQAPSRLRTCLSRACWAITSIACRVLTSWSRRKVKRESAEYLPTSGASIPASPERNQPRAPPARGEKRLGRRGDSGGRTASARLPRLALAQSPP